MNEAGGNFRSAMRIQLGLVTRIRRDKACLVSRSVAANQLQQANDPTAGTRRRTDSEDETLLEGVISYDSGDGMV
jgi:hypothetical protein